MANYLRTFKYRSIYVNGERRLVSYVRRDGLTIAVVFDGQTVGHIYKTDSGYVFRLKDANRQGAAFFLLVDCKRDLEQILKQQQEM